MRLLTTPSRPTGGRRRGALALSVVAVGTLAIGTPALAESGNRGPDTTRRAPAADPVPTTAPPTTAPPTTAPPTTAPPTTGATTTPATDPSPAPVTAGPLTEGPAVAPDAEPTPPPAKRGTFGLGANHATAVANNADGRLEAVWLQGGTYWHQFQTTPGGGWSPAYPLATAPPGATDPIIQLDGVGRLEAFFDSDAGTWNMWQEAPNSSWSSPALSMPGLHRPGVVRVAGPSGCGPNPPFPCSIEAGQLAIFGQASSNGDLLGTIQMYPGGPWHDVLTISSNPNPGMAYQASAFNDAYTSSPGETWVAYASTTKMLMAPLSGSSFTEYATPPGGFLNGMIGATNNADGRAEIFAVGADTLVYHMYETAPAQWSGWDAFTQTNGASGVPQAQKNVDGRLEYVATSTIANAVAHVWQDAPNAGWAFGQNLGPVTAPLAVSLAVNADGRLEAFFNSATGLQHTWQDAPAVGPWSTIVPL